MAVVFPDDATPPPAWWRSPLGRMCARHCLDRQPERMSAPAAAETLGIGPSRVYQLRASGKLTPHPDGGVTWASVAGRLATGPDAWAPEGR